MNMRRLIQRDEWPLAAGHFGGRAIRRAGASSEEPINILIVDDEPGNLVVLETVLDDPRYRLVRAQSADQALLALVERGVRAADPGYPACRA